MASCKADFLGTLEVKKVGLVNVMLMAYCPVQAN